MRGTDEVCRNCQYWHRNKLAIECRCKSPHVNGDGWAVWPMVDSDQWCGDWWPSDEYAEAHPDVHDRLLGHNG